jgi:DNA-binding CsgD family transcriptional regulator
MTNITRVDPATRPRTAEIRAEIARRVDAGQEDDPATVGTRATELIMAAEPVERTIELAGRAAAMIDPGVASSAAGWSGFNAARGLVISEAFDQGLEVLERAMEKAEANGAWLDYGGVLIFRGELYARRGDLVDAEMDARALLELARETGWTGARGMGLAVLGDVLVERGELEEALELLTAPDAARDGILSTGYSATEVRLARARTLQALGRLEEAEEEYREAGAWADSIGDRNPSAIPWRPRLAECLVELEVDAEAKRLAREGVELARRHGSPRALSLALRALARAEGGEREIEILREAEEVMANSPALLETAYVQFRLGAALRRERQRPDAAREHLRRAVDLAHRCGATALEDDALEELRATGARPRRRLTTGIGALTPSERRIAELAAAGQQNREIAEALFVTTNTVEFHLRNAYRKLEIDGRRELPDALAGDQP